MKKTAILLASTLCAVSSLSFATPNYDQHLQQDKGFYMGLQWLPGLLGVAKDADDNKVSGGYAFWPAAAGINAGYQFNRYVGVETGLQGMVFGFDGVAFASLSAKGILPVGNNFSLYAKAGPAVAVISADDLFDDNSSSYTTGALYGAVGMGIYVNRTIEFNIEQSGYYVPVAKSAIGFTGVGLTIHF